MTAVEIAAIAAALLLAIAVAFQVTLAFGAPLGEATMGGRARTIDGVLEPPFRVLAMVSAVILAVASWVILARAGLVDRGPIDNTILGWGTGVVAGFTALNTLSNVSGRHPLERWGMGSITLVVALLATYVAVAAP